MKPRGSLTLCRSALAIGPLVLELTPVDTIRKGMASHWRFGRRRFNPETVNTLIASGHARRVGGMVVAAC